MIYLILTFIILSAIDLSFYYYYIWNHIRQSKKWLENFRKMNNSNNYQEIIINCDFCNQEVSEYDLIEIERGRYCSEACEENSLENAKDLPTNSKH